jgi:hypothetical protein
MRGARIQRNDETTLFDAEGPDNALMAGQSLNSSRASIVPHRVSVLGLALGLLTHSHDTLRS